MPSTRIGAVRTHINRSGPALPRAPARARRVPWRARSIMPELPEVESASARRGARRRRDRRRRGLLEDGSFDEKIFAGTTAKAFKAAPMGRTLGVARRLGKHMWWEMHGGGAKTPESLSPLFHFGMTGAMSVKGEGASKYKSFVVDTSSWPRGSRSWSHVRQRRVARAPIRVGLAASAASRATSRRPPRAPLWDSRPRAIAPRRLARGLRAHAPRPPARARLSDPGRRRPSPGWSSPRRGSHHAGVDSRRRARSSARSCVACWRISSPRRPRIHPRRRAGRAPARAPSPSDRLFHHAMGRWRRSGARHLGAHRC